MNIIGLLFKICLYNEINKLYNMKSFPFIVYIMEMAVHLILDILMWKMGNWLLRQLSYIRARTYSICVCVMWMSVDTEIGRGGCTLSCCQHELPGVEWGWWSCCPTSTKSIPVSVRLHLLLPCLGCCAPHRHTPSPSCLL